MCKYTLVGVDGNAYAIMGYTAKALRNENLSDKINEMQDKAMSGNYYNLIATCNNYIELANEAAIENGYNSNDEDDYF